MQQVRHSQLVRNFDQGTLGCKRRIMGFQGNDAISQKPAESLHSLLQVITGIEHVRNHIQDFFPVMAGDMSDEFGIETVFHQPEYRNDGGLIHFIRLIGNHLIQQAEAIANTAIGLARQNGKGVLFVRNLLLVENTGQKAGDFRSRNSPEVESLGSAENGLRNFMGICSRQNEFDMLRRLLQGFQQGVESLRRKHVDFIDNIYAVFSGGRRIFYGLPEFPYLINAAVGSAINLKDIQIITPGDFLTNRAGVAGVGIGGVGAVKGFCQDSGCARFADAPCAGEHVGMRHPSAFESVLESSGNMGLANEIFK
ncbi:hypothetical protein ES708_06690 [subsurface metagenome]